MNESLFHLRIVDEIRASPAKRDENASLYSYNPLTVKLIRIAPVAGNKMKAVATPDAKSVNTQARPLFSAPPKSRFDPQSVPTQSGSQQMNDPYLL